MRLLLITGAGASRNLNASGSDPIVLMDGWAQVLRDRFGPELSELLGLHLVKSGQDFEEHLGELARWLELMPLNERFAWMTSGVDHGRDGNVGQFLAALANAQARGERFQWALDESLFEQFGPARFDAPGAGRAYNALLSRIGAAGQRPEEIVCATTNYDRSIELALSEIYGSIRTGFRYDGITTPTLSCADLGSYERQPAVLYLHGAVGWYRGANGAVVAYPASDPFRPDLGRPAVLYPSRNKAVSDNVVRDIWSELDKAITDATHVFILGHGLADEHLVARLRGISVPLAVSFHTDADAATIEDRLPAAHRVKMDFGPEPKYDGKALADWCTGS